MKQTLTLYNEFLKFREEFTNEALRLSIYSEKRDDIRVRPVVRIANETDLRMITSKIARWNGYVERLIAEDPVRFNDAQTMFKPEPKILFDQSEILIRENVATSTRLIKRDRIVFRLRNTLRAEEIASGGYSTPKVKTLRAEVRFFEDEETEDVYRIRSEGYTEILLLHRKKDADKHSKTRVPLSGIYYFDEKNETRVSFPSESRQLEPRRDSLAALGLVPVKCSLNIRGVLLRESERLHALERYNAKRLAGRL